MDKRLSGSALRGKRLLKYKPSYHTYQGLLLSEAQVVVKPQVTKADRQRYGKGFVAFSCPYCLYHMELPLDRWVRHSFCKGCKRRICPIGSSFMEVMVFVTLRRRYLGALWHDYSLIGRELDVYLPNEGIAIEVGSWYQHKGELKADMQKRELCEEKGVRLLTIYNGKGGRGHLLRDLVQRGRRGVPWAARRGRQGHNGGGPLSEAAHQPAGAPRHGRRHAGEVGRAPLRDVAAGGRRILARGRRGPPGSGGQADVHEPWARQERRPVRDRRAGGAAALQGDGHQGHRAGRREAARHREGAGPRDPLHLHALRGEHAEAPRHRRAHGCAFGRRPRSDGAAARLAGAAGAAVGFAGGVGRQDHQGTEETSGGDMQGRGKTRFAASCC